MDTSARSRSTGKGSRGGHWHEPEYRREYFRRYRREHPEYREREQQRSLKRSLVRQYDALRQALGIT